MKQKLPILLPLILFGAALLRYFSLELEPVDHLEIGYYFPMLQPDQSFAGIIRENLRQSPQHQPLFVLLLFAWSFFGEGLLFLRAFPALLGVLSVLATYHLGSTLFHRRAGLLAAALVAVSPLHIEFSRVLSPYALYSLLALLLAISLVEGLRQGRIYLFAAASAAGICLFYTHFYSIVFTGALYFAAAFHLLTTRRSGKPEFRKVRLTIFSLAGIAVGAAAYAPVAVRILATMKSRYAEQAISLPAEPFAVISLLVRTTIQLIGRFNGLEALPGFPLYVFLLVAGLVLVRLFMNRRKLFFALLPMLAVPFIQQYLHSSSTFFTQGFEIRYYAYLVPFYLIAAAGALAGLFPEEKNRTISAIALVLAGSVISLPAVSSTRALLSEPQKPDYRYASAFLKKSLRDGDALIVLPEAHYAGGFEANLGGGGGADRGNRRHPPGRRIGGEQDRRFSADSWRWKRLVIHGREQKDEYEIEYFGIISVSGPRFPDELAGVLETEDIGRVWTCLVRERFHDERDLAPRETVSEATRDFLLSRSSRHGSIEKRFNGIRLDLFVLKKDGESSGE